MSCIIGNEMVDTGGIIAFGVFVFISMEGIKAVLKRKVQRQLGV